MTMLRLPGTVTISGIFKRVIPARVCEEDPKNQLVSVSPFSDDSTVDLGVLKHILQILSLFSCYTFSRFQTSTSHFNMELKVYFYS